jgi:hypothetical protein
MERMDSGFLPTVIKAKIDLAFFDAGAVTSSFALVAEKLA